MALMIDGSRFKVQQIVEKVFSESFDPSAWLRTG